MAEWCNYVRGNWVAECKMPCPVGRVCDAYGMLTVCMLMGCLLYAYGMLMVCLWCAYGMYAYGIPPMQDAAMVR